MVRLYVSPEKLLGKGPQGGPLDPPRTSAAGQSPSALTRLSARVALDEAAHRHLVKVLRLGVGESLQLFDGRGAAVDATIVSVGKASVEVELGERHVVPAPTCTITLLQSVPRGERMDFIVQKTTELGVARIVPVLTEFGVVKPPPGRHRRWRTIAEEAARQCGRADVPAVEECTELGAALAQLSGQQGARVLLWEDEHKKSFRKAVADGPKVVVLLVGPEGGFSSAEVAAATSAGFVAASLGPRILRTETAAMVAVTLAQAAASGLD
jgi:16S rRNA (uracil1498-N3)-methyltransferase